MNKNKLATETISYSIARKDSGYCITKHKILDGKVTSSIQVTEPDVLTITMANLERIVRKQHGL